MTKFSVDVSTDMFRRSHGHEPRGFGAWGFFVADGSSSLARDHVVFFTPAMNFSDAKVWAKAHARKNFAAEFATGFAWLEVAP